MAHGSQAVVGGREAADCRTDADAWSERGSSGADGRVNANQVFLWRRVYRNGELLPGDSTALLPVVIGAGSGSLPEITGERGAVHAAPEEMLPEPASGAIHIEFPGRAAISVERGADRALLRTILESLCR